MHADAVKQSRYYATREPRETARARRKGLAVRWRRGPGGNAELDARLSETWEAAAAAAGTALAAEAVSAWLAAPVPVLDLERVSKVYLGSPPVQALDEVSLAVRTRDWSRWSARRDRARARCCT